MLESNDLEIKFASGEMDHLEEQVFLSKLSPSEASRVNSLKVVFSDLRSFRHDVPAIQFSAERLKQAIDNADQKSLPSAGWFKVNRMWMPIAASLVLVGFLTFIYLPQSETPTPSPSATIASGEVVRKSMGAMGFQGSGRKNSSQVVISPEAKNSKLVQEPTAKSPEVANSATSTNATGSSLNEARKAFNKPRVRKNGGLVARLDNGSSRVKDIKIRPGSKVVVAMVESGKSVSSMAMAIDATPGISAGTASFTSEDVRIEGNKFGTLQPMSSKPEIIIIVNSPEGSDSNEAVEVNHRVNIIIGS